MQDTNEQEIKPSKNGDFTRNVKDHFEQNFEGWRVIGESAGGTESKRLAAFSHEKNLNRATQMKWVDLAVFEPSGQGPSILIEIEEGNHLNPRTILADVLLLQWCKKLLVDPKNEKLNLLSVKSQPCILVIGTTAIEASSGKKAKADDSEEAIERKIETVIKFIHDIPSTKFQIPAWIAFQEGSILKTGNSNRRVQQDKIKEVAEVIAMFAEWRKDSKDDLVSPFHGWHFKKLITPS